MRLLLYLILFLALFNSIIIDKALQLISAKELKRRARHSKDQKAARVYKMAAYGRSLSILLWIKGSVAAALLLILLFSGSWWAALVFVAVLAWLVKGWHPRGVNSWVWSWAALVASVVAWAMTYLQPVLRRLSFHQTSLGEFHSGLYEKEDLIELISSQSANPENRIEEQDLHLAQNALTFGDKKVGDVMVPMRKVRLVTEDELVGPLLMDELHKTGFSRFPVAKAKAASPDFVGTLYLRDTVGYEGSGRVRDIMSKKVYYINETQSLRDALAGFLKTHHHQFVVVNNFEEIVGVLSMEDVLEQILGEQIVDEFDRYEDLRAVAGLEASKTHTKREHVPSPEQTTETVVE
jgi:metal transporter CNNM